MSLRTKLLAAIVGLNGAILLLALYLILQSAPSSDDALTPEVMAALVMAGGAIPAELPLDAQSDRVVDLLRSLVDSGRVLDPVIVEEVPDAAPQPPGAAPVELEYRVWEATSMLQYGPADAESVGGERAERAVLAFQRARQQLDLWIGPEGLAVVLPAPAGRDRGGARAGRRGLVAGVVRPPAAPSGVRDVYVVMVVGVIVLTGVSFWLVSHWVIRPLEAMTRAADHIAAGQYDIRIERRGTSDELDRTISAFNRMAREIAEYQGHLEDRVLTAIDRMKKAEQHLGIAQRLTATGKLAAGVAHEINNPLGGMRNAVRALARGDLSEEKVEQYMSLVSEGLARIEETVKKFLAFTPHSLEARRTDLAEAVRKALALAEHRLRRDGVALTEVLPSSGEAVVYGDPHELQQVVLNLVLNAADAIGDDVNGRIEVRVAREGEGVTLEVEDTGVGMAAEDLDRCFDMFFTTKEVGEGTGLGLAVVHTIVTNHGGRIEVESRPGEGSTFRVVLPAESEAVVGDGLVLEPAPE